MSKKRRKVANLLNRIQFIDLAQAANQTLSNRKPWLRHYLDRALSENPTNWPSYEVFRKAIPSIYGVKRDLDPSPDLTHAEICNSVKKACRGQHVNMNVEATTMLYSLVQPKKYSAYDHPEQSLALGMHRKAAIRINHYLVSGPNIIFQYPYPRKTPLNDDELLLAMSMISHSYAVDDFEGAIIEVADLSCEYTPSSGDVTKERVPRIHRLNQHDLISMDEMSARIQSVHDLLIEIGNETD